MRVRRLASEWCVSAETPKERGEGASGETRQERGGGGSLRTRIRRLASLNGALNGALKQLSCKCLCMRICGCWCTQRCAEAISEQTSAHPRLRILTLFVRVDAETDPNPMGTECRKGGTDEGKLAWVGGWHESRGRTKGGGEKPQARRERKPKGQGLANGGVWRPYIGCLCCHLAPWELSSSLWPSSWPFWSRCAHLAAPN